MNWMEECTHSTWEEAEENLIKIPVTWMDPKKEDAELWTIAYQDTIGYHDIVPTLSGGISKKGVNFRYFSKLIDVTSNSINLYVVRPGGCYAFRFRDVYSRDKEDGNLSGCVAFNKFRRLLQREGNGFELGSLAIPNGLQVKQTIATPDIRLNPEFRDKIIEHAFHVDIHQAYFAGIVKHYGHLGDGAFGHVVEYIYEHRNDGTPQSKYNKSILNCSQGFMQSRWCIFTPAGQEHGKGYALSHLSKAGIEDCKKQLAKIIELYEALGCKLIGTNTDGAWFMPPQGLHNDKSLLQNVPGYGFKMGEFAIDHYDCLLRYRSRGAYEFIEDGIYTPIIRGRTHLDYIKPRTSWEWGDIYHKQAEVIKYCFLPNVGIYLR